MIAFTIFTALVIIQIIKLSTPPTDQPQVGEQAASVSDLSDFTSDGPPSSAAITTNDFPLESPGGLPPQQPLTINSSHEDIWRRQLMSHYLRQNIWVDVSVILHGPSDYYGPPRAE